MIFRNKENLDQLSLPFAPLYYAYGMSLLNNSIQQASILGDAVIEASPPEDQQEEPFSEQIENGDENEDQMDVEQRSGEVVEKTVELIDDLQAAWEVLDMARVIYDKAIESGSGLETSSLSLKLANVYLALGDVSMESDSFDSAAEDFKKALRLRQAHLSSDDRAIPEVLFKIGVAYEMADRYPEARENMKESLDLLRSRNDYLEKVLNSTGQNGETLEKIKEEIADLDALFPDLEAKVIERNFAVSF